MKYFNKITILLLIFILFQICNSCKNENIPKDYIKSGDNNYNKGNFQEAIIDYTKAIEIYPNDAKIYINRGVSYANIKNYSQAITDFTKAIEINPDLSEAYLNRGNAYAISGTISQSISDFSKAIEINPDYKEAYFNRGNAYAFGMDNFSQACSNWQKAYQLGHKPALELINKHCK